MKIRTGAVFEGSATYTELPPLPAPLTLDEWLATPDADDVSGDGSIDVADYLLWLENPFISTAVTTHSWATVKQQYPCSCR